MKNENAEYCIDIREAAEILGVSVQYLYQCRHAGRGPASKKIHVADAGSGPVMRVRYRHADLTAWSDGKKPNPHRKQKEPAMKEKSKKPASKAPAPKNESKGKKPSSKKTSSGKMKSCTSTHTSA